jgi:valyl-tRNA synthetase
METAYEILFFWVARMMMLGLFCMDEEPFHTVYLHGIVRDPTGSKMSKTKGNVVDPLEMIADIGADALRVALVSGNAPGVDQRLTESKLTGGRNFTNKLWNAARFVLGLPPETVAPADDPLAARWIRSRLSDATERATRQLEALDLSGYAATVHEVAWSDYCDWFLEMAKVDLRREDATDAERAATWRAATEGLATILRLLHPLMPFVTEEIWGALSDVAPEAVAGDELLIRAAWPTATERDPGSERAFDEVATLIRGVRNLRTDAGMPAGAWVPMRIDPADSDARDRLRSGMAYLQTLARVRPVEIGSAGDRPLGVATSPLGVAWLEADSSSSGGRRERQLAEVDASIERVRTLLSNDSFTSRAPESVVQRERERLAALEAERLQLQGS